MCNNRLKTIVVPNNEQNCTICYSLCNDAALKCTNCKGFTHTTCSELPLYQLQLYENKRVTYYCPHCTKLLYKKTSFDVHASFNVSSKRLNSSSPAVLENGVPVKIHSDAKNDSSKYKNEMLSQNTLTSQNSNPVAKILKSITPDHPKEVPTYNGNRYKNPASSEDMDMDHLIAIKLNSIRRGMGNQTTKNVSSRTPSDENFSSFLSCSSEQPDKTNSSSPISSTIKDSSIIACGPPFQNRNKNSCETISDKKLPSSVELGSNAVNDSSLLPCGQKTPNQNKTLHQNLMSLSPIGINNYVSIPLSQSNKVIKKSNKLDRSQILCRFYERNSCKFVTTDQKCRFWHPEKCSKYTQFGPSEPNGCKSEDTCDKYHPILCEDSLTKKLCLDDKCRAIHIKGTKRKPPIKNHSQNQIPHLSNEVNFLYNRIQALETQLWDLTQLQWWKMTPPPQMAQLQQK